MQSIATSIIRVGQAMFVTAQIDDDSNKRIINCIQILSLSGNNCLPFEVSFYFILFGCEKNDLFYNWLRNELKRRKLGQRRLISFSG